MAASSGVNVAMKERSPASPTPVEGSSCQEKPAGRLGAMSPRVCPNVAPTAEGAA